jgi:acetyl esterase
MNKQLAMKKFITLGATLLMQNIYASASSWWDMTPEIVKEKINQRIMSIEAPIPAVWSVENRVVKEKERTTPIRIYTPDQGNDFPVILLIHGGAWVAGNLDTHDNLARYLCSKTKAIVVSVGYTNSPEGKFPLPLEQCYDALVWSTNHGNEFSAKATKIAVVGDSAGGNMAAALCLMARDRSGPKIDLQVLINPAPDLTCNGTIERQDDALDVLRWQAFQYVSNPADVNNPYVSPLITTDLGGLPATVVILAENDDLRDAGQKYADRLRAASVPTFVYCQQGIGHLAGDGAKASLRARESLDVAVNTLQNAFSKENIDSNQKLSTISQPKTSTNLRRATYNMNT